MSYLSKLALNNERQELITKSKFGFELQNNKHLR